MADLGITKLDRNDLYRSLKRIIDQDYRTIICRLCFVQAARKKINFLLYDVTTLYFEVQKDDEYRKPGLSKEKRLEPQIIIGLLVDQSGFPLSLHSFEGNTAETKTIIPVIEASFRMAKSDLRARPIFHRKRDSIEAHLTIVLAALAVGRYIELKTQLSIKQFVKLLRPVRADIVTINGQDYLAEENIPPLIHNLLKKLHSGH